MAVVGEPLAQFVLNQVGNRQRFFGESSDRSDEFLQYAASRTAWVKLASGVKLEDTHTNLSYLKNTGITQPKNYVLFNGTSQQSGNDLFMRSGIKDEGSYDTSDSNYGIVPMPGIESVDIKAKNRGSIKEAIVKIKCNSKRQFDIIDHLYLRLGYDMLLEFGWSHYITDPYSYSRMGQTLTDHKWFDENEDDNRGITYWLKEIQKLRVKYKACYDGFFGRVTNFDWNIDKNGAYNITLKLITHGDVIESLTFPVSDQGAGARDIMGLYPYIKTTLFQDKAIVSGSCYDSSFFTLGENSIDEEPLNPDGTINPGYKGFNFSKNQQINVTPGIDQLSQHLLNLQFIGRGVENYELELRGNHLRRKYNNEEFGDFGEAENSASRAEFLNERSIYWSNQIKTNEYLFVKEEYKKVFGLISIGADPNQWDSKPPWNKPFYSNILKTNKSSGLCFYSKITGNGALNGTNYSDAFVLYTRHKGMKRRGGGAISNALSRYHLNSETYVRFQYILYYIQEYILPKNKKTFDGIVDINWKNIIPAYVPPSIFNMHLSYDPGKVLIQRQNLNFNNFKEKAKGKKFLPKFGVLQPYRKTNSNPDDPVVEESYDVAGYVESPYITAGDITYMDLRNVYLNSNFLLELLNTSTDDKEKKIDLYSFLKGMCDAMNEAFCNMNQIEPVIDDSTNQINIIDAANFKKNEELYKLLGLPYTKPTAGQLLQMYGYRRDQNNQVITNFVRDFQLKSKISKELATMITVGATSKGEIVGTEATAFSRFNKGIINRFAKEYEVPNSSTTDKRTALDNFNEAMRGSPAEIDMLGINWRDGWVSDETFYVETMGDKSHKNMSTMNDVYKEIEAHTYKDSNSGSPEIGFIPFSLEIDLDGISGYKIYNLLNTSLSFLPSNYPKSLEFVLSGVDHKISNNDWVTHLTTIAVPKIAGDDIPQDRPLGSDIDSDNDIYTGSIIPTSGSTSSTGGDNLWISKAVEEHRIKSYSPRDASGNAIRLDPSRTDDDNKRILEYGKTAGKNWKDDWGASNAQPWCAAFVSWVLEESGFKSTKSARSKSYRGNWSNNLGKDLGGTPSEGCIVTWKTWDPIAGRHKSSGHVSFLVARSVDGSGNTTHIWCYGGNQNVEVKIDKYTWPNVLGNSGVRKDFNNFSIPDPAKQSGPQLNYTPKPQGWNNIPIVNTYTEAYAIIGITSDFNPRTGYTTSPRYQP
jgi:hypothetical protein